MKTSSTPDISLWFLLWDFCYVKVLYENPVFYLFLVKKKANTKTEGPTARCVEGSAKSLTSASPDLGLRSSGIFPEKNQSAPKENSKTQKLHKFSQNILNIDI